jgi:hypothetical protein
VWWLGLLKYPPHDRICISSPRRVRNRDNIVVHGRRSLDRLTHRGLPVSTPSQSILDYAATGPHRLLRLVLATAEYERLLDLHALEASMGRGIDGTVALRDALRIHLPELAHTRGDLEIVLLEFCESYGFPLPQINVYLHGWLADAYWPTQRVVVEVDDWRGHRTPAQLHSNHRRDLGLRAAGLTVLRYAGPQLIETPGTVASDLGRYF